MDKNGKLTTVHRRDGALPSKASSLAGIKPSLPQTPTAVAADDKVVKVKWKVSQGSLPLSEKSFLTRMGMKDEILAAEIKPSGHAMTRGEVFEFMKLGLSFMESAALHQIGGPLEKWLDNQEFKDALPGNQARVFVKGGDRTLALDETMELFKREGVSLNKAAKLVKNGLSDERLQRSVLAPHEIFALFNRFSYQPSINPDDTTNSTATMDALNEGLLPFDLVENIDADKSTMTNVLYALYPPGKKKSSSVPLAADVISDSVRQELIDDHEKLSQTVLVMSRYKGSSSGERLRSIDVAVNAINEFGFNACMAHHPGLLTHTLSDGTALGYERATEARRATISLGSMLDKNKGTNYPTSLKMSSHIGGEWTRTDYADVAEFKLMGKSDQEIFDLTLGVPMDSNRALAIAQKNVAPVISSGWL